jgi:hypothetical protein
MAWIFQLAAEFGCNRLAADKFQRCFSTQKLMLGDRQDHQCDAQVVEMEGSIWCIVIPGGLTRCGIRSIEDAELLSGAGEKLYRLLRKMTGFRYAIVGIEAACIGSFEEVRQGLVQGDTPGLVIAESAFSDVKPVRPLEMFVQGYLWWPYVGE